MTTSKQCCEQTFENGYSIGFLEGEELRAEIKRLHGQLEAAEQHVKILQEQVQGFSPETTASIEWSEVLNPDAECSYTHLIGKTPFGRILATWKGWKDHFDITVDESPWGFMGYAGSSPEEAKRLIEARYNELLREAIGSAVKTSSPQRLASELRCIHSVSITQYCQRCADCNSHMDEGIRSICFGSDGIFAEKTPAPIRDMIQANLRGGPAAHDPAMAKAMDPSAYLDGSSGKTACEHDYVWLAEVQVYRCEKCGLYSHSGTTEKASADQCEWTRLPDATDPFKLDRVSFKAGCNGLTATGLQPVYPDICPGCSKPVIVASEVNGKG